MISFSEFLNEDNNDYVNISNDELKDLYNEFNNKYFNGNLPDIEVKYGKIKGAGGVTQGKYNKKTKEVYPELIKITTYYKMTEEELYGIMIHEMIHVHLMSIGVHHDTGGQHGYKFKQKRKELLQKVNFHIPIDYKSYTAAKLNHDQLKTKEYDVLIRRYGNKDRCFITVFNKGVLEDNEDELRDMLEYDAKVRRKEDEKFRYVIVRSDIKELSMFPHKRKISRKTFNMYKPEPEVLDKLLHETVLYVIR